MVSASSSLRSRPWPWGLRIAQGSRNLEDFLAVAGDGAFPVIVKRWGAGGMWEYTTKVWSVNEAECIAIAQDTIESLIWRRECTPSFWHRVKEVSFWEKGKVKLEGRPRTLLPGRSVSD
jgi:hypothetical protein